MSVSLQLHNLQKTFTKGSETFTAVHNVELTVAGGEMVTFLGPSGCGKTTILRMVAGFETPTSGSILVDGEDVTNRPVNSRGMGFVFQNYALFPHMSIFENVAYGLRARKEQDSVIKRKVLEGLELVGLPRVEARFPSQLSGGEQQRVALARVLVLEPHLLLMDEPLSNLDAKLRLHMRTEIRRIQKHLNITCLYVTHDQKEALTLSDRVMVLRGGLVEQIGQPHDLYVEPRTLFVADFIGQANILSGLVTRLHDDATADIDFYGVNLRLRTVPASGTPDTGKVSVILRPENLEVVPRGTGQIGVTVKHRFFVGDHLEYELELPSGQSMAAHVPCKPDMAVFEPDTPVDVAFPIKSAVVLFSIPDAL